MNPRSSRSLPYDDSPRPVSDALARLRTAIRSGRTDNLAALVTPILPRRRMRERGCN